MSHSYDIIKEQRGATRTRRKVEIVKLIEQELRAIAVAADMIKKLSDV